MGYILTQDDDVLRWPLGVKQLILTAILAGALP